MTENIQTITTLHDLLICDTRRFTSAEAELKKSLQDWIIKAGSLKLKTVLQKYLDHTGQHIDDLEDFFEKEGINSLCTGNRVMRAFIQEINEKLSCCTDNEVRDACLLAGIQEINHFKISMYGTAAAFAKTLGNEKQAAVFHKAEVNEKQIDDRLSQLAEHEINSKAKAPVLFPGN